MKKYLRLFFMFCMIMTVVATVNPSVVSAYGTADVSENTVIDNGLFADTVSIPQDVLKKIAVKLGAISEKYTVDNKEIGVYIAVVDWYGGYGGFSGNVEDAVDYFCINAPYNMKDNGVLLFLSIGDREYDVYTFGEEGKKVFNDYAVDDVIIDSFYDDLHDNQWEDALYNYIEECESLLKNAERGKFADYNTTTGFTRFNWLISAVIGLFSMLIVRAVLTGQMKSVQRKVEARNYVKEGSFNISYRNDCYTHSTESRRKIERSSSSSSSGKSRRSHHSGRF